MLFEVLSKNCGFNCLLDVNMETCLSAFFFSLLARSIKRVCKVDPTRTPFVLLTVFFPFLRFSVLSKPCVFSLPYSPFIWLLKTAFVPFLCVIVYLKRPYPLHLTADYTEWHCHTVNNMPPTRYIREVIWWSSLFSAKQNLNLIECFPSNLAGYFMRPTVFDK